MTTPLELEDIFLAALELGKRAERNSYLEEACRDQPELRQEVERLLGAHPDMGSFLEVPPSAVAVEPTAAQEPHWLERPGTVIGAYKLLEPLGEGGFAVVFMAEQTAPVRRKVAVKVIKPGMDTRQVIARFEAERQALALMDHPNIAKVFDGGKTESGRPFFAMELVRGFSITEYCDKHQLATRQRLELFVQVCQAVQHAHQKGIIHRDIKPSNVLVAQHDGAPVPKVIDFGVAKALSGQLTDQTIFTAYQQLIGTPLYMSPEQAEMHGADIDTRSDIYSLGVLLYELLTGTTPFDSQRLQKANYDEIRRIIREEEPVRPSTRITTLGLAATTVSANRQSAPRRLSRLYRGELDWIVLKALEKDRNRRYETAGSLAMDVQRFLTDKSVLACPPSAAYRLRKFVRRNKLGVMTTAAIALAFLVAAGSLGWMARDWASRQVMLDQKVGQALVDIESFYSNEQLNDARGAVERAEALLDSGPGRSELQQAVRQWREDLDLVAVLEQLRIYKKHVADEGTIGDPVAVDIAYLKTWQHYGLALKGVDAEEFVERFRSQRIALKVALSLDDWAAMGRQARGGEKGVWHDLLVAAGQLDPDRWRNQLRDALQQPDSRRALDQFVCTAPIEDLPPATLDLLGKSLWTVRAHEQAVAVLRKGVERHPHDFWINYLLAINYGQTKPPQWDQSVRYYTVAAALRPDNHLVQYFYAGALEENGSVDEAIAAHRRATRLQPDFSAAHNRLGHLFLWRKRRIHDAALAFQEAVRYDPKDVFSYCALGQALRMEGKWDEAVAACRQAIRLKGLHPHDESKAHYEIGKALWHKGQPDEAEAAFRDAIRLQPSLAANLANDRAWLSIMYPEKANVTAPQAVDLAKQAAALEPSDARWWNTLGAAHYRVGAWKEAIAALEKSVAIAGGDVFDWLFLAMSYWQQGDKVSARKRYDQAVKWIDKNQSDDSEIIRLRAEAESLIVNKPMYGPPK
jgi:serine/threonine protein kinase/tetratricopeptide (TPR) repeat protein